MARATPSERAFWERVIEKGDQHEGDLPEAMAILARHGAIEAARQESLDWAERARAALDKLPVHDSREMLLELVDLVVDRVL